MKIARLAAAIASLVAAPLAAQDAETALQPQQGSPPERIDLLTAAGEDDEPLEDCSEEQEAALLSGEIVVCRRRGDMQEYGYDKERAERRYARETMNKGNPQTPDPCGPNCGIFKGPPTVGGLCVPGLQKCPPPPAYFIDFDSLPDAPPGSDADRIARGLPPLGRDAATPEADQRARAEQLGLPPAQGEEVSPSGSASPAAEPSG